MASDLANSKSVASNCDQIRAARIYSRLRGEELETVKGRQEKDITFKRKAEDTGGIMGRERILKTLKDFFS